MTRISESFTFIVNSDICEIVTHSRLSKERLQLLLSFVFEAYAPITVISESVGNIDYAYTFAQLIDEKAGQTYSRIQESGVRSQEHFDFTELATAVSHADN